MPNRKGKNAKLLAVIAILVAVLSMVVVPLIDDDPKTKPELDKLVPLIIDNGETILDKDSETDAPKEPDARTDGDGKVVPTGTEDMQ